MARACALVVVHNGRWTNIEMHEVEYIWDWELEWDCDVRVGQLHVHIASQVHEWRRVCRVVCVEREVGDVQICFNLSACTDSCS